jgi:SAM-dependent methyltransferase
MSPVERSVRVGLNVVVRAAFGRLAPPGSHRRQVLVVTRRQLRGAHPARIAAVALRRHRDSWKNRNVALQMRNLARKELQNPLAVPPYRVFVESITELLDAYPVAQPARLLDFGCGTGHYSAVLDRYFPGRFSYVGCDYAPEMIEIARAEWPQHEFIVNDAFDNRLNLDTFDVIFAAALVDVLVDYERALDILLASGAPYVLLHRQRITEGSSHVEVVEGYSGQLTYASHLSRRDLERAAARHRRTITHEAEVDRGTWTFLLVRGESGSFSSDG